MWVCLKNGLHIYIYYKSKCLNESPLFEPLTGIIDPLRFQSLNHLLPDDLGGHIIIWRWQCTSSTHHLDVI